MKKKSIISFFLLQFLISTTGLPLTFTICTMKPNAPKADMCSMCKMEKEKSENCSLNKINHDYTSPKIKSLCCVVKSIDFSVKDNYLGSKYELKTGIELTVLSTIQNDISDSIEFINSNFSTGKSPPILDSNQIYKKISTFLI